MSWYDSAQHGLSVKFLANATGLMPVSVRSASCAVFRRTIKLMDENRKRNHWQHAWPHWQRARQKTTDTSWNIAHSNWTKDVGWPNYRVMVVIVWEPQATYSSNLIFMHAACFMTDFFDVWIPQILQVVLVMGSTTVNSLTNLTFHLRLREVRVPQLSFRLLYHVSNVYLPTVVTHTLPVPFHEHGSWVFKDCPKNF